MGSPPWGRRTPRAGPVSQYLLQGQQQPVQEQGSHGTVDGREDVGGGCGGELRDEKEAHEPERGATRVRWGYSRTLPYTRSSQSHDLYTCSYFFSSLEDLKRSRHVASWGSGGTDSGTSLDAMPSLSHCCPRHPQICNIRHPFIFLWWHAETRLTSRCAPA